MDCCSSSSSSSSSYADYRQHSMNGNFCYPYSPNMLRSASPYPAALAGGGGGARYGTDYRSSPLGYPGPHPGGYDGYDKYYGSYHHGPSSYPAGYYGNYPSSYRDYGGYTGHYYHQSQSPYARGGGPPMYGATPATAGSYLYPGRHYPGPSSNHHPFASRESYSYHAQREHHQQQQYSSFANYTHLPPYRTNGTHDHPGGKSHHQPTHQQQQQQYPTHQTFTAGSHNDRGLTGNSSVGEGPPSTTNTTTTTTTSAGHPSPSTSSLYSTPNGGYSSPSSDYTLAAATATGPPSSSYGSGESPQHPLAGAGEERDAASSRTPTATPTPSTALLSATASAEFPHGTKDTRMRKPKERKLQRNGSGGGGDHGSRPGSPSVATVNGLSGSNGAAAAATRMKSLDALTNMCWPEEDQFPGRMRKYSTANGLKSREGNNSRKESNELEGGPAASPSRTAGPTKRTKKQTSKQAKETKSTSAESRDKQTNGTTPTTPPVENKNVTPLPGFQQAFGSTEIGKFSEVFFNSSPSSANHSTPPSPHHHHHHHHHPLQLQPEHHQQGPVANQRQGQQVGSHQAQHGTTATTTMQQLVMESLNTYESDVDTLSPQPWDSHGTVDTYDGATGSTGYGLQIGSSNFHPSYYESSSYSDHAVDSPLGNYFSEMTCNEFVN